MQLCHTKAHPQRRLPSRIYFPASPYFQPVILFADTDHPRLRYVAHWLGHRLLGQPLQVCTQVQQLPAGVPVLAYSQQPVRPPCYHLVPQGLLASAGWQPLQPAVGWVSSHAGAGLPCLFPSSQGQHPFDVLAAVFYCLSRYEEYASHYTLDEYQRYSHTNSLLYRQGWLLRPLADEWLLHLRQCMQQAWPGWQPVALQPSWLASYDVDIAWCYRHKGGWRKAGGGAKELWQGRWSDLGWRMAVLLGLRPDPFDLFDELQAAHARHQVPAHYFFLGARRYAGYDRNIDPRHPALQRTMRQLAETSAVGLHASWAAAAQVAELQHEHAWIQQVLNRPVLSNRMHYLRFQLPHTYRQLLQLGIRHDYSMGYGTINGFRAATSHTFLWYDLLAEQTTELWVHPFGWMDANSIFEQKDDPDTALAELTSLYRSVQATGGCMVAIWHNHLLGRQQQWQPWWQLHSRFLQMHQSL